MKYLAFLKGKKTYTVGVLLIIVGLLQNDMKTVLEGLGFMSARAAIANLE